MKNLEEWRDIEGYEGLYQVSNLGRVKSLKFGKEKFLSQGKRKNGYLQVVLCRDAKRRTFKVHRLVAQEFIENPLNLREINHLDENKENNAVDNLEWCTREYNINHGSHNERVAKALSKKVFQYSLDGKLIKEWQSVREVERQLEFANTNICKCCNGKYKQAYGYIWQYED